MWYAFIGREGNYGPREEFATKRQAIAAVLRACGGKHQHITRDGHTYTVNVTRK